MSDAFPTSGLDAREHDLVLTRFFVAPPRAVFDAWTHPRQLRKWWGPDGTTLSDCEVHLRPGGHFRFQLRDPDGVEVVAHGSYLEVHPPSRLTFTMERDDAPGELLVTAVSLVEFGAMVRMTVQQSPIHREPTAHHQLPDWLESLERLSALLE